MRRGLVCALLTGLALAEEPGTATLKDLYEQRKWAELHDALGDSKKNHLYRGAVAAVFNEDPHRTEKLLLSTIKSAPRSEDAYDAYEWLSHLYFRYGQYRRLSSVMEQRWAAFPEKSERKQEEAEMRAFAGCPIRLS